MPYDVAVLIRDAAEASAWHAAYIVRGDVPKASCFLGYFNVSITGVKSSFLSMTHFLTSAHDLCYVCIWGLEAFRNTGVFTTKGVALVETLLLSSAWQAAHASMDDSSPKASEARARALETEVGNLTFTLF